MATLHPEPAGPTTDGQLPAGTVVAQNYRIERLLGHGGMGNVYLALHTQLGRRVAIKTLRAQALAMADLRARFRREAMAAANLHSEHIAQVIDLGELPDGSPYMVMEYLEGQDLAATLQQRGPLPVAEVVDLLQQACAGVAVAHARGIVHRDLKPANLFLVSRPGSAPLLKVLDFGIAKAPLLVSSIHTQMPLGPAAARTNLTQTDVLLGSVRYMAPEQMASARDVDARADLWSLGVIAYRLLTGRCPFVGDRPEEVFLAAARSRPAPIVQWRPDVPPALAHLIDACLQPDLALRCPSVAAMQQALAGLSAPFALPFAAAPSLPPTVVAPQVTAPGHTLPVMHPRDPSLATAPAVSAGAPPRSHLLAVALFAGMLMLVTGVALVAWLLREEKPSSVSVSPSPSGSLSVRLTASPGGWQGDRPVAVRDMRHVDPVELLPQVRVRAIAVDPTAVLSSFLITSVKGGSGDLSHDALFRFVFRTTPQTRKVLLLTVTPGGSVQNGWADWTDSSLPVASLEPRCPLSQAWSALVRAGKTPTSGSVVRYSVSADSHDAWDIFLDAGGSALVHGQTCALVPWPAGR